MDEIEPLSGQPFVHVILSKSHVKPVYQFVLPIKMTRTLPDAVVPVVLMHRGKSWATAYNGKHPTHKRFDNKWRSFVEDNRLGVGDACVFELMECTTEIIKLKVQILQGDFPSELLERIEGTSSDNPVIVDED